MLANTYFSIDATSYATRRSISLSAFALIVSAHALLAFGLLHLAPVAKTLGIEKPLMISLITPQVPEQSKIIEPPKPKPVIKKIIQETPKPILAAPEPSPAPSVQEVPPPPETSPTPMTAIEAPPAPVTPPHFNANYLDNPAPLYPRLSRRLGEEGKVVLRVYVESNGEASHIQLQKSSGFGRLDGSALETVRQWKFVPARQNGQAIGAWIIVPISFNLEA